MSDLPLREIETHWLRAERALSRSLTAPDMTKRNARSIRQIIQTIERMRKEIAELADRWESLND